jgi:hypothetical protein
VLIDGAPKPVFLSVNSDHDLVKVPFVAEPASRAAAHNVGKAPPELLSPHSYSLVRDDDAAGSQDIFHHPQTHREPEMQPHRMSDHFGWKSVATIERIPGKAGHAAKSHIFLENQLSLRCRPQVSGTANRIGRLGFKPSIDERAHDKLKEHAHAR